MVERYDSEKIAALENSMKIKIYQEVSFFKSSFDKKNRSGDNMFNIMVTLFDYNTPRATS